MLLLISYSWAQTWEHFNEANSNIPQNKVSALSFDQDGLLWVGAASRGLSTFDGTTWTQIDTAILPELCVTGITDIGVSPTNNDVWVVAQNPCGILQYDRANASWIQHGLLFNYGPRSVDVDSEGVVWIGNEANGGLFRYAGADFVNFTENNSDNPNDYVYAVGIINKDKRWIAGTHGVGLMDDQGDWLSYDHDDYGPPAFIIFGDVVVQNDSISWFSHRKGLLRYNVLQDSWQSFNQSNAPIPDATCRAVTNEMAIDNQGNLWIGSCGGLLKFDGINWTIFNTSNSGIPSNSLTDIAIDDQQNIWIGLLNEGLAVYRPNQSTNLEQSISNEAITIYPNPAQNQFRFAPDNTESYTLSLYSVDGKQVLFIKSTQSGDLINTHALPSGMYTLIAHSNSHTIAKKLIINK